MSETKTDKIELLTKNQMASIADINESIIIADFVGDRLKKSTHHDSQQWKFTFCDGFFPTQSHFKFKTSWDWLMPVLERIHSLRMDVTLKQFVTHEGNSILECCIDDQSGNTLSDTMDGKTLIESTYYTVVEFIKWYNQQTPPNGN